MRGRAERVAINAALLLGVSSILLVSFELLGAHVFFADRLDMVHDVDHRPDPAWPGYNADGLREESDADAFDPDDFNIVLLGDSFVMGLYLEPRHTISEQLETLIRSRRPDANRGVHVLNFGWISASPFLSRRQLIDVGSRYSPDLVVQCIDMTDFQDDLKYERFLRREGIYGLVGVVPVTFLTLRKASSLVPPFRALHETIFGFPARRFFVTDAPLAKTRKWLEALRANVNATAAFSRKELNASFAVCVFPRSYQYSKRECPENWEASEYEVLGPYVHEPFAYFETLRSEVDYPIYSLLPDFLATSVFPTCFEGDPHWTPAGASVAARALYHYLSNDGYLNALGVDSEAP